MSTQVRSTRGVRVIAVMEVAKAAIVLVAGFGLLWAIHDGAAQIVEELAGHMHLNPAKGFPRVFIELAHDTSNSRLWLLSAGAFSYAAMRCIEAFGLWRRRRWAEWFSVASGSLYVPIEVVEIAQGVSTLKLVTLLANVGIVVYMGYALRVSRREPAA
jgi:uncharacterized membrane protein (DUF2068 family)